MALEKDIKRNIRRYLNTIPKSKFVNYSAYMGEAGTPDIIGCIDGDMVLIEVKRPGKKPTALQDKRMDEWENAGAYCFVVTGSEEIKNLINNKEE